MMTPPAKVVEPIGAPKEPANKMPKGGEPPMKETKEGGTETQEIRMPF